MSRGMVGLLAAVGAAMSLLASVVHGGLFWVAVTDAAAATGLAAYLALPSTKKSLDDLAALAHLNSSAICSRLRPGAEA